MYSVSGIAAAISVESTHTSAPAFQILIYHTLLKPRTNFHMHIQIYMQCGLYWTHTPLTKLSGAGNQIVRYPEIQDRDKRI